MDERELFPLKITNLFPRGPDTTQVAASLRNPSSFRSLPTVQGFLSSLPLVTLSTLYWEVTVMPGTLCSSYEVPPLSDTNRKLAGEGK